MTEQTQPTDAELQSIIDDADAGPPTDKAWLCLECGRWTPWRHEEAHDHADGCKAPAIYAAKRDWKTRLKDYMANRGTPAGAGRLEVTEAECEAASLELETEDLSPTPQATQAQAGAVPLTEARRLFDAGWKAAALFCDREDVVADGIIGFGACPQFEAAFTAARAHLEKAP